MTDTFRPQVTRLEMELGDRTLTLETGLLAEQAHGAVMVRYGDTMILGTVTGEREARPGADFFPLAVDYEEKMYAAGKIPGGFIKREGRPTDTAILAARLTDRPIRPLWPKGYRAEVQIINTVMSSDQENNPDILSMIAASAALCISPLPFQGPVGAVRVGLIDDELVINPSISEMPDSIMDIVVAGTADAIMMVEGEADRVPEETLIAAFEAAQDEIARICELQEQLMAQAGKEKWAFNAPQTDEVLQERIQSIIGDQLRAAVRNPDKVVRLEGTNHLKQSLLQQLSEETDESTGAPLYDAKAASDAFDALLKAEVRNGILVERVRPDGRTPTEIRPIWSQTGYLPRTHGSAIFTRGQTQVITTVTLGSTAEEQRLDGIIPTENKRYMHHYNFPPYSVGEVRRSRGPGRREIGHGTLAERALVSVLPSIEDWPYTMRLVSEVVSSNGSTSMASVCGSSMALMDAGVPLAAPVAGVAMGLITDGSGAYTILTDIQGMEDALGDMDFKVAGTADGVTAIQMDIKVKGITSEIMREALQQAHDGRQHILGKMAETISQPNQTMSPYAPMVKRVKINPDKIGALIGPGGKMIRSIQEETETKIDIDDDGGVSITGANQAGVERALQKIAGLTQEFKIDKGDKVKGKVVSVMPYGAFVELAPGRDGLVHISELSDDPSIRVNRVEDVINVGDEIEVMVIDVAPNGKISLSRRAAITGEMPEARPERGPRGGGPGGGGPGGDRGPRGGGFGGGGGGGFRGDRGGNEDRGPRGGGMAPDRPGTGRYGDDRDVQSFAPRPQQTDGEDRSGRPADSRRRPDFGDR
ncbi:MAG TPA: polyribonucleotide nucleotidyltransferase [Thermomicrobiales bacterium]|jgi:polyribonucleotide nucleotidyltransferase|nr:polyribonucleotide nucleotidyltransferase [Thermomicrobiales bacterium]